MADGPVFGTCAAALRDVLFPFSSELRAELLLMFRHVHARPPLIRRGVAQALLIVYLITYRLRLTLSLQNLVHHPFAGQAPSHDPDPAAIRSRRRPTAALSTETPCFEASCERWSMSMRSGD